MTDCHQRYIQYTKVLDVQEGLELKGACCLSDMLSMEQSYMNWDEGLLVEEGGKVVVLVTPNTTGTWKNTTTIEEKTGRMGLG